MNLSVKSYRHAEAIAAALNRNKSGVGSYYLSGYDTRRLTEQAAVQALQEATKHV